MSPSCAHGSISRLAPNARYSGRKMDAQAERREERPPVSDAEFSRVERDFKFIWRVVEKVNGSIARGARVLDLGCGYGSTVWLLTQRGYDAVGIDVFPYWAEPKAFGDNRPPAPARLAKKLTHVRLDDYRFPYQDRSIDIAISSQVFEHVADFGIVLRELGRVLKPDGLSINVF